MEAKVWSLLKLESGKNFPETKALVLAVGMQNNLLSFFVFHIQY